MYIATTEGSDIGVLALLHSTFNVLTWNCCSSRRAIISSTNHTPLFCSCELQKSAHLMNSGFYRLVKINSVIPKGTALISSKSCFDWCWHYWDIYEPKMKTDRQTDKQTDRRLISFINNNARNIWQWSHYSL